jgi:cell division protein FtsQ
MPLNRRTQFLLKKARKRLSLLLWVVAIISFVWSWQSGAIEEYVTKPTKEYLYKVSGKLGFVLKDIYISGNVNTSSEEILKALGAIQDKPIFGISLTEARNNLESLGWVKSAKIERQLPSTLHVMIIEKEGYAIWQNKGDINLIDFEGSIILEGNAGGQDNLPIIVGEDANIFAKNLFSFLSEDEHIFNQISSIIRVGGRRWNIRLNSGIEIKLPEEKPELAWKSLIELQREKKLLDRNIKYVDLRVSGKLFIEPLEK